MLKIDRSKHVGKGHHREVYVHPENSQLCIKIIFDGSSLNTRRNSREISYYKHLERRQIAWEMLPKYHGLVKTDLGLGTVFDLICDHDGTVSKTLQYYFASEKITEENYEGIRQGLKSLKQYLLENRIMTLTPEPRNIVYQKNHSGASKTLIIDNIGNTDHIPICNYFAPLARVRIRRKWKRFVGKLERGYYDNKSLIRMLDTLA